MQIVSTAGQNANPKFGLRDVKPRCHYQAVRYDFGLGIPDSVAGGNISVIADEDDK